MNLITVFTFYIQKIKNKFIDIISEEWSDQKVALAISLGFVIGVVPFFLGLSIYLSFFVAWRFKLNHILIQFISNIIYPLQLLLFIPFLKFGTSLFSLRASDFSFDIVFSLMTNNPLECIRMFGMYNIYGLLLWLIISSLLSPLLYFILKRIIKNKHLIQKDKTVPTKKNTKLPLTLL